jgi:RNA polymerase sigma factor (TIGR02999 family)
VPQRSGSHSALHSGERTDVTELLGRSRAGDHGARDELFAKVYAELRQIADRFLARERTGLTLQPTDMVHEAYLRLTGGGAASFENRAHFFGAAARAIRRILIDRARARRRARRGGGKRPLPLEAAAALGTGEPSLDLLALDEALERLAALDPLKAQMVELRFFGGLTADETAAALGTSPSTVAREWRFVRAWLHRELCAGDEG